MPGDLAEKFDMRKKVPLRRVGEHQELANLAAYLVSDYSAYINGEVVTILSTVPGILLLPLILGRVLLM